jgi:Co/Zn/Cd efflux system component
MTSSKDPPSFIVLAGDTAGLAGIAVAASGTLLATSFNLPAADGIASIVVGMVLAVVGWVLVRESKGLLIGEQAGSELSQSILALAKEQDGVEGANGVIATHLRLVCSRGQPSHFTSQAAARSGSRKRRGLIRRRLANGAQFVPERVQNADRSREPKA